MFFLKSFYTNYIDEKNLFPKMIVKELILCYTVKARKKRGCKKTNGGDIMSTENKELETVVSAEEAEQKKKKKKKKLFTANRIEIVVAVFLGITALLTAWATWIGSLHGGNQSTNYTKSNNLAAEANSEYNAAMQLYLSDLMAWNTAIDYQIDAQVARMKGQEAEAQIYENKMQAYITQNSSSILAEAINSMTKEMTSPFEVEGTVAKYFEKSNKLSAESQALLEEGKQDNANGDAYNLVNVIFSVVLFLLGIVGVFKNLPNRAVVLCIAIVGLVIASIYMFTIPLPTGFDFFGYFGMG